MSADLDRQKVKEKAVDLAFAARMVMQQLALKDGSAESREARDLLERALTNAIPDGVQMTLPHQHAA
jgi:hypothetical protein